MATKDSCAMFGIFLLVLLNEKINCQDTCNPCTGAVLGYCCSTNDLCCDLVQSSFAPDICPSLSESQSRELCKKSENRCKKPNDCPHPNEQDCCPTRHCGSVCISIHSKPQQ